MKRDILDDLRSVSGPGGVLQYGDCVEASGAMDLIRRAADEIGWLRTVLATVVVNLDPKNNPVDRKWIMDRTHEFAQASLRKIVRA